MIETLTLLLLAMTKIFLKLLGLLSGLVIIRSFLGFVFGNSTKEKRKKETHKLIIFSILLLVTTCISSFDFWNRPLWNGYEKDLEKKGYVELSRSNISLSCDLKTKDYILAKVCPESKKDEGLYYWTFGDKESKKIVSVQKKDDCIFEITAKKAGMVLINFYNTKAKYGKTLCIIVK